jgi:hypothetical protein
MDLAQMKREKDEQIRLCVDMHSAMIDGTFDASKFTGRIAGIKRALKRWRAHEDERVRLAAVKMAEILTEFERLACCKTYDRKWKRIMAGIYRKSDVVDRLLTEVGFDGD